MSFMTMAAQKICERAATIANEEAIQHHSLNRVFLGGQIFVADPGQSEMGGLCLSVGNGMAEYLDAQAQTLLHEIGTRAMGQSLVENKKLFAGMIIEDLRAGRSYFDRFTHPGGQV